jgi:hypothetical protein
MSSKVPKKKQNKKPLISVNIEEKSIAKTPKEDELQKLELIEDEEPYETKSHKLPSKPTVLNEPEEEPEEEDDEKNEGYYYDKPPKEDKPKKPRTEKQLEQLRQARVKALVTKELKRKEKEQEQAKIKKMLDETKQEQKKALEQKVVKKALSIKKKEIKKQEVLDEISDDETPIEKIKIPKKNAETTPQKKNIIYFD